MLHRKSVSSLNKAYHASKDCSNGKLIHQRSENWFPYMVGVIRDHGREVCCLCVAAWVKKVNGTMLYHMKPEISLESSNFHASFPDRLHKVHIRGHIGLLRHSQNPNHLGIPKIQTTLLVGVRIGVAKCHFNNRTGSSKIQLHLYCPTES